MRSAVKRLSQGDDLRKELHKLMADSGFSAATVASLVGSLSQCRLRCAGAKRVIELFDAQEIVAATGTLTPSAMHVHVAVSDENGTTIGGHLLEGCIIASTCEVVLNEVPGWKFNRVDDASTRYAELHAERL